jgi:hypothetical protein
MAIWRKRIYRLPPNRLAANRYGSFDRNLKIQKHEKNLQITIIINTCFIV